MLTEIKNKRSLTFYQQPAQTRRDVSAVYAGGVSASSIASVSFHTADITTGYYWQLNRYLSYNQHTQQALFEKTQAYMDRVYAAKPTPTASALRDHSTWRSVKRFVTREELMKLQVGDTADLPLSKSQLKDLKIRLADKDLTSMTDKEINKIIDLIVSPDDSQYMAALKEFKATGKASDLLQQSKLDALKSDLEKIDLSRITAKEYKHLKENYCEKNEYHHKESISSNPIKQSDADNVDILKTSGHDKKHTHIKDGKESIDYSKPVKEPPNNRNKDLQVGNRKRVLKNEIHGLGIAVAIGAGIGLTIGFVTTLAQAGVTPDSLKLALAEGTKGGLESGILSAAGYGIGRTIGEVASNAAASALENLGLSITDNISKMINMGVVGTLTILVFSTYQFVKLKFNGVATKEALIQTGRQALFSLSLLAVSIAAQGMWGGAAGMIVSISIGVVFITYSVADSVHQRHFAEKVRVYMIEKCCPQY